MQSLQLKQMVGGSYELVTAIATNGKSIATRRGFGKTWHDHTRALWVQQRVHRRDMIITKV